MTGDIKRKVLGIEVLIQCDTISVLFSLKRTCYTCLARIPRFPSLMLMTCKVCKRINIFLFVSFLLISVFSLFYKWPISLGLCTNVSSVREFLRTSAISSHWNRARYGAGYFWRFTRFFRHPILYNFHKHESPDFSVIHVSALIKGHHRRYHRAFLLQLSVR